MRARLSRILAEARAADALPWEQSRLNLFRTIVPDIEARRWRADFAAELERFGVDA